MKVLARKAIKRGESLSLVHYDQVDELSIEWVIDGERADGLYLCRASGNGPWAAGDALVHLGTRLKEWANGR